LFGTKSVKRLGLEIHEANSQCQKGARVEIVRVVHRCPESGEIGDGGKTT
jgi:hypothetical protein